MLIVYTRRDATRLLLGLSSQSFKNIAYWQMIQTKSCYNVFFKPPCPFRTMNDDDGGGILHSNTFFRRRDKKTDAWLFDDE